MESPEPSELARRLAQHLEHHLGAWPPPPGLTVVGSARRNEPEWDGVVRPVLGLETPAGTLLSVPPARVEEVAALAEDGMSALSSGIGALFDRPGTPLGLGCFRPLGRLVDLPPLGEWVESDDPRLPDWLRPFNGGILITTEDGAYAAGVGLKAHDADTSEIAVGTEEAYRGRGLARRLVCTAARREVLAGRTTTYEHALDNHASAAVAAASGFDDVGWRAIHLGPVD